MLHRCLRAALLLVLAAPLGAQTIQMDGVPLGTEPARRQHVELLTSSVLVTPGKPSWVELRFRVDPGFHINSHTPHDELLLPTTFEAAGSGPEVKGQQYPAGIPLHLAVGEGEVLSTYQGEFLVRQELMAPRPGSILEGVLRYQACDARSCFPPQRLPVQVSLAQR